MTKVAFASDFHVDRHRGRRNEIIAQTIVWLQEQSVDVLLFAGDLSNTIDETIIILEFIAEHLGIVVRMVPGNHELWDRQQPDSLAVMQRLDEHPSLSIARHPYITDEVAIVGHMGWYDYSTRNPQFTDMQIRQAQYGKLSWQDRAYVRFPYPDQVMAQRFEAELERQLQQVQSHNNIIAMSHIVPFASHVVHVGKPEWDYFSAYIGNTSIGALYEKYGVKVAHFGHTHRPFPVTAHPDNGIISVCTPLGYKHEWRTSSVQEQVRQSIQVLQF